MQRVYFDLQHVADVTVVTFTERELVDEQMLHTICERLAGLADTVGQRELLLNLGNVIHVNSLALAKFVGLNTVIQSRGRQLTFCNLRPLIYEVFRAMGLDRILCIRTDRVVFPPQVGPHWLARGTEVPCTMPGRAALSRPWNPIVLCDCQTVRVEALVTALARDVTVVHVANFVALAGYCDHQAPVAVALPLVWSAGGDGPASHHGSESPVWQFLRSHSRRQAILVYADTDRLPLQVYCQALDAGVRQV
ncbi:MAG: STAS domain-containing protein [Planctomycetes bacterium]|nr:STAS domain-containing protein [Planctomycetota bacterium]